MGNTFKTAFLLTLLTVLLMFIGRFFGGQNGMLLALAFAFAFAAVMNFVSYFCSDKIALRIYRLQPVTREQLPRAYAAVERLTGKIGIPIPKIYVIPNDSPNAFATGRNPQHASVAVTQGILNLLTDEELEGVLAHELGRVNNRDILIGSVAATVAGAIEVRILILLQGLLRRDQVVRNGMHRKRNPVLHPYFSHQLGDVRLHGALFDAQRRTDLFVRAARHQHFQNFLFAVSKGHATGREDASRRRRHAFDEHGKHAPGRPNRALMHDANGHNEV